MLVSMQFSDFQEVGLDSFIILSIFTAYHRLAIYSHLKFPPTFCFLSSAITSVRIGWVWGAGGQWVGGERGQGHL